MEDKLDELIDLATRLIDEQKEMAEENRQIVSEIDHLYKRINGDNDPYRCTCVEEY